MDVFSLFTPEQAARMAESAGAKCILPSGALKNFPFGGRPRQNR